MGRERFRVIARAVILTPDRRVLLVTSRKGDALVLPGGAVDRGETLAQAAIREAKEECGLDVAIGPAIWVREFFDRRRDRANLEVYFLVRPVEGTGLSSLPQRWTHADADASGLTRDVGAYTQAELQSADITVYPEELRRSFWSGLESGFHDAYLGHFEA